MLSSFLILDIHCPTFVRFVFICPTTPHSLCYVMTLKHIASFPRDRAIIMPFDGLYQMHFTSACRIPNLVKLFCNYLWCLNYGKIIVQLNLISSSPICFKSPCLVHHSRCISNSCFLSTYKVFLTSIFGPRLEIQHINLLPCLSHIECLLANTKSLI